MFLIGSQHVKVINIIDLCTNQETPMIALTELKCKKTNNGKTSCLFAREIILNITLTFIVIKEDTDRLQDCLAFEILSREKFYKVKKCDISYCLEGRDFCSQCFITEKG